MPTLSSVLARLVFSCFPGSERREAVGRMARYAGAVAWDVDLNNASLEQIPNGSSRAMFRGA